MENQEDFDRIWAPWRIDYILSEDEEGCFFCKAFAAERSAWKEHKLLKVQEEVGVLLNKYPYNNGHILIAPNRHVSDLSDLDREEKFQLIDHVDRVQQLCRDTIEPDGFNVGMNVGEEAGAGVPGHLHVHVVPRWKGDHNFMPVTASTHVFPQSLDALYDVLVEHIEQNK